MHTNLGLRKASTERGVSGSNWNVERPAGVSNTNPLGAKEEVPPVAGPGAMVSGFTTNSASTAGVDSASCFWVNENELL